MIPHEANVGDNIGKAQRGLGISDSELAEKARLSFEKIRVLREGGFDEAALMRVGPVLGLNGPALCALASDEWSPKKIGALNGLEQLNTDYHAMPANPHLVWYS